MTTTYKHEKPLNRPIYACSRCGDTESLQQTQRVWVRANADSDEIVDWDDGYESVFFCEHCGAEGDVFAVRVKHDGARIGLVPLSSEDRNELSA